MTKVGSTGVNQESVYDLDELTAAFGEAMLRASCLVIHSDLGISSFVIP